MTLLQLSERKRPQRPSRSRSCAPAAWRARPAALRSGPCPARSEPPELVRGRQRPAQRRWRFGRSPDTGEIASAHVGYQAGVRTGFSVCAWARLSGAGKFQELLRRTSDPGYLDEVFHEKAQDRGHLTR